MDKKPAFAPMKVEGTEVSVEQLEAAYANMRERETFSFHTTQNDLIAAGVLLDPAYRTADRLLQKLQREGFIKLEKRVWKWA